MRAWCYSPFQNVIPSHCVFVRALSADYSAVFFYSGNVSCHNKFMYCCLAEAGVCFSKEIEQRPVWIWTCNSAQRSNHDNAAINDIIMSLYSATSCASSSFWVLLSTLCCFMVVQLFLMYVSAAFSAEECGSKQICSGKYRLSSLGEVATSNLKWPELLLWRRCASNCHLAQIRGNSSTAHNFQWPARSLLGYQRMKF